MMGAPGMRSAQLPNRATLDLSRLQFLLRLYPLPGFRRTHALFDSDGGKLQGGEKRKARNTIVKLSGIVAKVSG